MKIAVYIIAKNETGRIGRAVRSAASADYILVCDTGSTDDTAGEARKAGALVDGIRVSPWRFDTARNTALALVPSDADVCVCLEADEVLVDGWREAIVAAWTPGTTQLTYLFRWAGGTTFRRDRIHARNGYRWQGITHEALHVDSRIEHKSRHVDTVLVIDAPPDGRCGGAHYMPMLKAWVAEEPYSTRAAWYYGRELFFNGDLDAAMDQFFRAFSGGVGGAEREYGLRVLGRIYHRTGNRNLSELEYYRAIQAAPHMRCHHVWMAEDYYKDGDWAACLIASQRALKITERANVFTEDPRSWGPLPHDLAAIASWNLGDYQSAVDYGTEACKRAPDDRRLAANLVWYKSSLANRSGESLEESQVPS